MSYINKNMKTLLLITLAIFASIEYTNAISTFTELKNEIDNTSGANVIDVDSNIAFTEQIEINRDVTINGIGSDITFQRYNTSEVCMVAQGWNWISTGNCHRFLKINSGFVLTVNDITFDGGYAAVSSMDNAGAIYTVGGNIIANRCTFKNNKSIRRGGAIALTSSSNDNTEAVFTDCVMENNEAFQDGGGGFINANGINLKFNNCTFNGNNADTGDGGAVYISGSATSETNSWTSTATFDADCSFSNNKPDPACYGTQCCNGQSGSEGICTFDNPCHLFSTGSCNRHNDGKWEQTECQTAWESNTCFNYVASIC